MSRPLRRSLIVAAIGIVAAVAWFWAAPPRSDPASPVAVATPTSRATTSPSPSPSPSPTAAPTQAPASPVADPPRATLAIRKALSLRLDGLRARYGLPGVSAAILFADGSIWRGTSGLADVAAERPVTPDTGFAVGSITKTFLAALILRLAEEGAIDLEATVRSYLPQLEIGPTIKVRQLLDHTSGLHDFFYDRTIDKALLADRTRVWTTADVLSRVGKPYFKPGHGWHYSNTNYVILGILAETVGGAPLAGQLRERFLAPLGLDQTRYQAVEPPLRPLARAYRFNGPGLDLPPIALSDGSDVVPFTSVVTAAGSAGSLASTAEDLVRWARALYGGSVLRPESLAAMIDEVGVTAPFKPSVPYGLGVQAATVDGRPTLGHSGRLLGARSVVRWLPDEGIAIAVLTNQSRADPNHLVRALLRVVLGVPPDCADCATAN